LRRRESLALTSVLVSGAVRLARALSTLAHRHPLGAGGARVTVDARPVLADRPRGHAARAGRRGRSPRAAGAPCPPPPVSTSVAGWRPCTRSQPAPTPSSTPSHATVAR